MTILITGGAGSLGKAFVRLLRKKHDLIVVDNNEWAVAEFQDEFPGVGIHLNDFNEWRFHQDPVDLVIHCAAYKCLDLGEKNAHSFIENNITKTGKLFAEAYKHGANILFISSDKAVEPISTYGFTKALGEKLCWYYNGVVARVGNILESTNSVIPVWEKALKEKKPIKITDIKMARWVIDADNAVKQIWDEYDTDSQRNLIIPKCKELSIMEILKEVFNRHKIKADDYPMEIIGIRKGEKLKEKLRWEWE